MSEKQMDKKKIGLKFKVKKKIGEEAIEGRWRGYAEAIKGLCNMN